MSKGLSSAGTEWPRPACLVLSTQSREWVEAGGGGRQTLSWK